MTWFLNALGALLVVLALRDIFHTLWHPRGVGPLCRALFALVWRVPRVRRGELAGPIGILVVVITWTALIVAGWTLVYLPHMPDGFYFDTDLEPELSSDLVGSVYLSLVTVGTLGFGDITPAYAGLRLIAPLQALVGFILLTAALAWVLQVYPALTRRRALAKRLSLMAENDTLDYLATGDPVVVTRMLEALTEDLLAVRMDLLQYGETYYFREQDPQVSLAANLAYALDLAHAGKQSGSLDVRHAAALLDGAVASTVSSLDDFVGNGGSVTDVLAAFADDHGQRALRE
ncbi:MAG TPA: potassium channel family protein [Nocardioidaceae bacterium]|nr:potassium channel family protein [Nocardioidaceae bacterium]